MKQIRTGVFAAAVTLTTAASLVAPASSLAQTDPPPQTQRVTPHRPSTTLDTLGLIAGSRDAFVYAEQGRIVSGSGGDPQYQWTQPDLLARTADGKTRSLGTMPKVDNGATAFSLVRSMLTVQLADAPTGGRVRWWSLATHTSGSLTLHSDEAYQGAAPTGVLVRNGEDLVEVATDGTRTDLGTPFPGNDEWFAKPGDDGVLASTDLGPNPVHLAYRAWKTNGYTALDTAGAPSIGCVAVEGEYAACPAYHNQKATLEIIPVDGSRTSTVATSVDQAAVVGNTVLFTDGIRGSNNEALKSVRYGSTTVHTDKKQVGYGLLGAFGKAMVINTSGTKVASVSSVNGPRKTLVAASASPTAAAALALGPGRLVYADDRQRAGAKPNTAGLFATSLSTDTRTPKLGKTKLVVGDVAGADVYTSGTTTVYTRPGTTYSKTRVVVTPRGRKVISGTFDQDEPSQGQNTVSGNRFLYEVESGKNRLDKAYVYNAATGRTKLVLSGIGGSVAMPALFGNYLAYTKTDGSVWRKNIVTGKAKRLSKPLTEPVNAKVFSYGNYVGWNIYTGGDAGQPLVAHWGFRNARTMSPVVHLHQAITQVSGAGVTLGSDDSAFPWDDTDYVLHTWSGRTVQLLPTGVYYAEPRISGRTMAWSDQHAILRVAPVPGHPAVTAPRYLGAAMATASVRAGHAWSMHAPYSEQLNSCRITLRRHRVAVRTLRCDRTEMKLGVAHVTWNGRYGGHPAPAGTYSYRISASGSGGSARNAVGDVRLVRGHVIVR